MKGKLLKVASIRGKKRYLLKEMGYKSITQAKKYYNFENDTTYNDEQIYNILKNDFNEIVEGLQVEKSKTGRTKKVQLKQFLRGFQLDDITRSKPKPDLGVSKTFKNLAKHQIVKNNDRQAVLFTSFINNAIPIIRHGLKEMGGLKLSLNFELMFKRQNSNQITPFYLPLPNTYIITHVSEVNQIITSVKTYLISEIPEMALNKSGWNFAYIGNMDIGLSKYKPLKGGSYLPLDQKITNKKCCINIKNTDDKCLIYCILYHLHQDAIPKNADRVSNYTEYENEFDFSKIKFPIKLNEISKVEEIIDHGINVFGYDKNDVIPLRITKRQDNKIINVLMIGDCVGDRTVQHFVYIKRLDVLVMPNKNDANGVHRSNKSHICVNCLHGFCNAKGLQNHREKGCDMFEPVKIELPKISDEGLTPTIKFNQHDRKYRSPVVIYADFETLVCKTRLEHDDTKSSTTPLADLPPCGFAFNIVSEFPELNLGLTLYRGENAVEEFLKRLLKCGDSIRKVLDNEKKMIITDEEEGQFKKCKVCNICDQKFKHTDVKVRDHCHITGLYRGCCHQGCNINLNHKNFQIPVYFHNLKGFDGHLIIQGLSNMNFSNIKIIAQNFEKYMSFAFGEFRFLDSFAFMSSSLDTLASNLLKDGKSNFIHTLKNNYSDEQNDLILKKGVYPYEYMDTTEKFSDTALPKIDDFYSVLSESRISEEEYEHALKVWDKFNITSMGEYHDLYLKTDVLLLTDVFEAFRNTAIKNYKLDPCNGYFTLPNYAWNAMLLKTGVVLDQLTDIDMYLFCEQGIRGGTSMISHRYAKANNKYMESYDRDVVTSYIMYLDANNLYGEAMTQNLPTGGFDWDDNKETKYFESFDADGDIGLFVECDLHYPTDLHDLHNNYPLAVESKNILKGELSPYQQNQMLRHNETHSEKLKKLVPNLYDKKNYVCHIKNLQYYVKKGLVITKIHRVLKFNQARWLKPYIDFNTDQRKLSKNEFEKDMYKLMNNAVFGKTMENMRARVDIQLYTEEKLVLKQMAKPQFIQHKIYSESLIAVKQSKRTCKLDKPIYIGVAVLDLSKLHMYKFHYDYMKPKYGADATLLFTDTDSLCYSVKTDDMYRDMDDDKQLFDRSGYDGEGFRSCDKSNAKVIGKFKDETDGVPIVEFCGLRSKMYSILLENKKEKKTGKGIKKSALKRYINHDDYKRCLLGSKDTDQRQLVSFNNLRSMDHNIGLFRYTKVGLSCSNDKQYLLDDGISSLSYGHKNIP